jgi:hypothetical protein
LCPVFHNSSFIIHNFISPTRLRNAWNIAFQRQLAEAQAAHLKLPQIAARPPADATPVSVTNLELGFPHQLGHH